MSGNWSKYKLEDISLIIAGQSPNSDTYNFDKNGLPFFQGKADFGSVSPTPKVWCSNPIKIAEKDDILLSVRAPVGPTNIADEKCCIGRGLCAIRVNNNVNMKFVYFFFKLFEKDISQMGSGSTFSAITNEDVKNLEIYLPPLEEQERIVKIIEKKLTAVEKAETASVEQIVNVNSLFPLKLKKYLNNKRWKNYKLIELCDYFNDGNWIETKDQSKSGIRLIQTGNIGNGIYLDKPDVAKYISEDTFNKLNCSEVYPNDILISRLPKPVGRACIVPDLNTKMITAVDCTIVRVNKQICDHRFLLYILMSDFYFNQVNLFLAGSTRERISRSNLESIKVNLTSLDEQQLIINQLEKENNIINKLSKFCVLQSVYINALPSSILRKAFNGDY